MNLPFQYIYLIYSSNPESGPAWNRRALMGFTLTRWGAKRFIRRFGDKFWVIRKTLRVNSSQVYNEINHTQQYINKLVEKSKAGEA